MATYVNDLRLKEISTGDESGTWGTSTNTNLELIGEALGYATQQVFSSDADATTTVADGASDPARAMYFKITSAGSLTATRTCTIAPNTVSRVMFIENATSGSQSIAISQGSGANVTIATGKTAVVYLDGAGAGAAVVDAMAGVDPGVTDTLTEVLVAGNTSGGTNIELSTTDKVQFRDAAIYINSSADGQLDIVADTEIQIAATTVDLNGNLDVSGTTVSAGKITADAGIDIDNINIDGTTIALSSGDLTLDVAGDIILDADGDDFYFSAAGTSIGKITNSSSDFLIRSLVQDKDIIFKGDDAGSVITALTLDMSEAGAATFNSTLTAQKLVSTNGILELDDNGTHNGIINSPASLFINIDSDNGATGEDFVIGKDRTGTSGGTELFRVQEDGKVLIGDSASHTDDLLQIETPASGGGHGIQIRRNDSNTDQGVGSITFGNNTATDLASISAKTDGATDNGALLFNTSVSGGANTERMRIDSSGRVGIGVTPEAWTAFNPVLRIKNASTGGGGALAGSGVDNFRMFANTYYDGAYKRLDTGFATQYGQESGVHVWSTAATGAGASAITWSESMRIDASGNVIVGGTTAQASDAVTLLPDGEVTAAGFYFSNNIGAAMNDTGIRKATTSTMVFDTASTERMRIDSSGNVGIGTGGSAAFSAGSGLRIERAATATLRLQDTGAHGFEIRATADAAEFFSANSKPFTFNHASELMRIDAGGSVLIGKTTPTDLHNTWNHIIIGEKGAIISENGAGGIDGITLADNAYIDADTGTYAYQTTAAASLITQSGGVTTFSNAASGSAGAALTPVTKMVLDALGRVGIGGVPNTNWRNDLASQIVLQLGAEATLFSDGGVTTELWNNAYINNADTIFNISTRGAGRYQQYQGAHKWWTAASASAGSNINTELGITPKMTLDVSGNLLLGNSTSDAKLHVGSNLTSLQAFRAFGTTTGDTANVCGQFAKYDNNTTTSQVFVNFTINNGATASGQINANGASQVAFGAWSDRRLKENIEDLPSQLANITALRPVEFDYIESEGGGHQLGFIAQEVEEIYPDLVGERQDGMKTLSGMGKMEARLIKAIQEQQATIEALTARIAALES